MDAHAFHRLIGALYDSVWPNQGSWPAFFALLAAELNLHNWSVLQAGEPAHTVPKAGTVSPLHQLHAALSSSPGNTQWLLVQRGPTQAPFGPNEAALMAQLQPHLQRAWAMHRQWQISHARQAALSLAASASSVAALALNRQGRVVAVNTQAEALLRAAWLIRLSRGHLQCLAPLAQSRLEAGLAACAHQRGPTSFTLSGRDRAPPVHTLCLTQHAGAIPGEASNDPSADVLCLIAPRARRVPTERQLMALFGLTPAESRLARALARGESLDVYAAETDIQPSTAKTQLRRILDKTGCKHRTELIQWLASIPAVR